MCPGILFLVLTDDVLKIIATLELSDDEKLIPPRSLRLSPKFFISVHGRSWSAGDKTVCLPCS